MSRRVVITGLGAVSGLGVGAGALWEGMCAGRSALRPITRFDASGFRSRLASEVEAFSAKDLVPKGYRKAVKVMARDVELAVGAAREAVADAGLITRSTLDLEADPASVSSMTIPSARMGCHIGAGLISAEADELTAAMATSRTSAGTFDLQQWGKSGMENLTPLWMLKYLPNMVACHVTIIHGACGPSNTITCAEASGILSIGESLRVIERDEAELCFCGGSESKLNLMGLLRMDIAGRLAPTGDETDGTRILKPFDRTSAGTLMGEGAGLLLLESRDSAMKRGHKVHAEIIGFGAGHSGRRPIYVGQAGVPKDFDLTAADEGFLSAIQNAMDDAKVKPDEIDAIVTLGSGHAGTDLGEAGALRQAFGDRLASVPLAFMGPAIGNCMAGAGGLLAVLGAMVVEKQTLPARINTGHAASGLMAGPGPSAPMRVNRVLVASSSLSGQNAALVMSPGS